MLRLACLFLYSLFACSAAWAMPVVKVGVLQGGTVHWELATMQREGLDKAHGFELKVQPYASLSATRLALTSRGVDAIVSDWLWAGQRQAQGEHLVFIPYSRSIGRVMVAKNKSLSWPQGLRGKRIGVAGGPYSKGWVLMQAAARKAGLDLKREAQVTFAAPPLLNAELSKGRLDIVVTFWHYGARLQAQGYQQLISLQTLTQQQGLDTQMPMLGYLFPRQWVTEQPEAAEGFAKAVAETKRLLAQDDGRLWSAIRPMMKAKTDAEFQVLRDGYISGIPAALGQSQVSSAQRFYQLIDQLRPQPAGNALEASLFSLKP